MIIDNFNEFLNEAFGAKLSQYGRRVKHRLLDVICDSKHISEKDFKKIDKVKELIDIFFDYYPEIDETIRRYEQKKSRVTYCAEHIYDWFIKGTEMEKEIE